MERYVINVQGNDLKKLFRKICGKAISERNPDGSDGAVLEIVWNRWFNEMMDSIDDDNTAIYKIVEYPNEFGGSNWATMLNASFGKKWTIKISTSDVMLSDIADIGKTSKYNIDDMILKYSEVNNNRETYFNPYGKTLYECELKLVFNGKHTDDDIEMTVSFIVSFNGEQNE